MIWKRNDGLELSVGGAVAKTGGRAHLRAAKELANCEAAVIDNSEAVGEGETGRVAAWVDERGAVEEDEDAVELGVKGGGQRADNTCPGKSTQTQRCTCKNVDPAPAAACR